MNVKVYYDFQIFIDQFYGGISRYIYELALRVNAASGFSSTVVAPMYKNRYVRKKDGIVRGMQLPGEPRNRKIYWDINWIASPIVAKFGGTDVLHETYYHHRPVPIRRKAVVLTVHDMIHERFRKIFPLEDATISMKKAAISRADHLICVSESTRRDMLEYFDIPEYKTTVVHHGFNPTIDQSVDIVAIPLDRPFLLYVGDRKRYKNFEGLLRAYASSHRLKKNFSLVCFGGGSFDRHEVNLLIELKINDDSVIQFGGSDTLLQALYKHATIFVCPSMYEGFGITLLEAMNAGCPVACSNTSSLPEIAGNAASFFDPFNPESIRQVLEFLAESDSIRADLTALGRKRIDSFSWDKCAEETMAVYRRTLGL